MYIWSIDENGQPKPVEHRGRAPPLVNEGMVTFI